MIHVARASVALLVLALGCGGEPAPASHAEPPSHVEDAAYDHRAFRPWRLQALAFKALRLLAPDYPLWRDFHYEYERDRLAIDLINGSDLLRRWVDDPAAAPGDLEAIAAADERAWRAACEDLLIYR